MAFGRLLASGLSASMTRVIHRQAQIVRLETVVVFPLFSTSLFRTFDVPKEAHLSDSDSKVWFITGSSRGFGRIWAEAALRRGDRVAATARDVTSLEDLTEKYGGQVHTIELDVTDKAAVDAAVQGAAEHFGRLDVVVNNAGYGYFGTVEEIGEDEARAQFETNVFGALWGDKEGGQIM